jgi:hypothetical protein
LYKGRYLGACLGQGSTFSARRVILRSNLSFGANGREVDLIKLCRTAFGVQRKFAKQREIRQLQNTQFLPISRTFFMPANFRGEKKVYAKNLKIYIAVF